MERGREDGHPEGERNRGVSWRWGDRYRKMETEKWREGGDVMRKGKKRRHFGRRDVRVSVSGEEERED